MWLRFTELKLRQKLTLVFFILVFTGVSGIAFYGYRSANNAYLLEAQGAGSQEISAVVDKIDGFLETMPQDLNFIAKFYALEQYLNWRSISEERTVFYWKNVVQDTLTSYLEAKEIYFKVRFMDVDGDEKINVQYNRNSGITKLVPLEQLQNNSQTDYFKNAIKLKNGEINVSNLNLNKEFGKFTYPYLPVIRYSTPVINAKGEKHGILVLNVYADAILKNIYQEDKKYEYRNLMLVEKDGSYLTHQDPTRLWDADLKHGYSLKNDHPALYKTISEKVSGTVEDSDHGHNSIVNFHRIFPLKGNNSVYWTLVNFTDKDIALEKTERFQYVFALILLVTLFVMFFVIRYFMNSITTPLQTVAHYLKELSTGNLVEEKIVYNNRDEIGEIIDSVNSLKINTREMIAQTGKIANGDYTSLVNVRSDNDKLSLSLNNMLNTLRENETHANSASWIQEGLNALNTDLSGNLSLEDLCKRAVQFMAKRMNAGQGGFYLFDKATETLRLKASYAFNERMNLSNEFELGEGVVGQAALEKETIILRNIKREEKSITTGLIDEPPTITFTVPVIYEKELYGVMELASFEEFTELQQKFLSEAEKVIATFIYSGIKNEEVRELLLVAEEATTEAQKRSEELQDNNAQMEEQQQKLQQQSEELQQTNSQMEEQQQQLRQQSEELQQANSQMEEQQQQVKQQAADLQVKNDDLERKQTELESSNQYKSEFLANMSHELRTPLNSIILLSKMMARNEMKNYTEEDVKKATIINNAGNELLRLINDILDISKIEAGQMPVNLEEVTTESICEHINDMFESSAKEKGVAFLLDDHIKGVIETDKDKLFQILRNFLSNAFKFTKKGSITLRIEKTKDQELPVRISVIDTGVGIPKEKQGEIFEAFRQVDGSITREFGGTGLGLSIALQFTKLLGGTINLESKEGKGSSFAILLPGDLESKDEETPHQKLAQPKIKEVSSKAASNDGKSKILIVEDDKDFASTVAEEIGREGMLALTANTGKDALRIVKEEQLEGIILDLGLPDMNGIEILRELKSTKELSKIPVYIISGSKKNKSVHSKDIIGYMQKPVNLEDIDMAIRELSLISKKTTSLDRVRGSYLTGSDNELAGNELKGKKILAVDDDVKNIFVLSSALETKGAEVIEAMNGKKALEILEETPVDLILMDIMMPEMDGYVTIKAIRKNEQLKSIPIIALTAKAMKDDKKKCIDAGANDYITKPVDYDTLISLAAAWSNKTV